MNIIRPAITTTNRPSSTCLIPPSSSQEEEEYTEQVSQVARGKRSVNRPKRQVALIAAAAGYLGARVFSYFGSTPNVTSRSIYEDLIKDLDVSNRNIVKLSETVDLYETKVNNTMQKVIAGLNAHNYEFPVWRSKRSYDLHRNTTRNHQTIRSSSIFSHLTKLYG